jgi:ABC-2 type transport system permease protein
MRNAMVIARRELAHYFVSPIAYLLAFLFLLILGVIFYSSVVTGLRFGAIDPDGRIVVGWLVWLLIFVTPPITMRLLADEQRMGTLEILLTAPVREWELILGKWLGSFGFLSLLLALTWVYPLFLHRMTSPGIDQGTLLAAYLGLVLMVAAMLAIGVLSSSLFASPMPAVLLTWAALLTLALIGDLGGGGSFARAIGLFTHYESFYQGVVQLADVAYFAGVTMVALLLSAQIVQSRRWG